MTVPLHLGVGHPTVGWLVLVGLLAFAVGLVVNLSRSTTQTPSNETLAVDDGEDS